MSLYETYVLWSLPSLAWNDPLSQRDPFYQPHKSEGSYNPSNSFTSLLETPVFWSLVTSTI